MRFKKGDKVKVSWKPRFGLPASTWSEMRAMNGVIVALKAPGPPNSKIVVELLNGDYLVQDTADDDQWTTIEKKKTMGSRMQALGRRLFEGS